MINLAVILTSAFVIGLMMAVLLFVIFAVLHGFVLLVDYGLSRGPVAPSADSRLKYFGILLGFFSMNPLIEGLSTSNWVEAFAALTLVAGDTSCLKIRKTLKKCVSYNLVV